jgi:hypothetical protein
MQLVLQPFWLSSSHGVTGKVAGSSSLPRRAAGVRSPPSVPECGEGLGAVGPGILDSKVVQGPGPRLGWSGHCCPALTMSWLLLLPDSLRCTRAPRSKPQLCFLSISALSGFGDLVVILAFFLIMIGVLSIISIIYLSVIYHLSVIIYLSAIYQSSVSVNIYLSIIYLLIYHPSIHPSICPSVIIQVTA